MRRAALRPPIVRHHSCWRAGRRPSRPALLRGASLLRYPSCRRPHLPDTGGPYRLIRTLAQEAEASGASGWSGWVGAFSGDSSPSCLVAQGKASLALRQFDLHLAALALRLSERLGQVQACDRTTVVDFARLPLASWILRGCNSRTGPQGALGA
jgi:hypothetical protein